MAENSGVLTSSRCCPRRRRKLDCYLRWSLADVPAVDPKGLSQRAVVSPGVTGQA